MRRQILQIISVIALLFSSFQSLNATAATDFSATLGGKCAAPATALEAKTQATAVFLGKAAKVTETGSGITLVFSVEKFWKGAKQKSQTITIETGRRYSPSFKVGERYIVYASGGADKLTTGRCSRTKLAEYADDDLKALGKGKKP